jgi:hypothetical protein
MDACVVAETDSLFLQQVRARRRAVARMANDRVTQASHLTGGLYLRPPAPQLSALLQFLLVRAGRRCRRPPLPPSHTAAQTVFLPEPALRSALCLPEHAVVDYRATCFCHRKVVQAGFVCPICLFGAERARPPVPRVRA